MLIPLSPAEAAALDALALYLGVDRNALFNLINFESGWNPAARNPISGARGLIQFMPATARAMGHVDADALLRSYPTRLQQLQGPVRQYLANYRPFTGTPQDLYMAVFYPRARTWPAGHSFPDSVQRANPGVRTPGDYVRKVYAAAGLRYVAPGAVLLIGGIALYFLFLR